MIEASIFLALALAITNRMRTRPDKPAPRLRLPYRLMKRSRVLYERRMAKANGYVYLDENTIGGTTKKEREAVKKLVQNLEQPLPGETCANLKREHIECAGSCKEGEKCTNSALYNNHSVELELFDHANPIIGKAVRTKEHIDKDQLVSEFRGKYFTKEYFKKLVGGWTAEKRKMNFFVSTRDGELMLDPTEGGSLARFVNHSCGPNCRLDFFAVNGWLRPGLFAKRPIAPGEELTFDYGDNYSGAFLEGDNNDPIRCLCNSPNCRGFIVSKQKAKALKTEEAKKAQKSRKRKAQDEKDEKKNDAKKAKAERKIATATRRQHNKKSPSPTSGKTTAVQEKDDSIAQTNNATITESARRKRTVPFAALDAPSAPKKFIIPAPSDPVLCPSNNNDEWRESSYDSSSRSSSFTPPPPTAPEVIMDIEPLQMRAPVSPVPSFTRTLSSTPSCTPPPPQADDNVNNIIDDEPLQSGESTSETSSSLSTAITTPPQDELINDESLQAQINDVVAVALPPSAPTTSQDCSALATAFEVLEGRIQGFEGLKIKLDGMGDENIRKEWLSITAVMGLRRKYIVDGLKSLKTTVNDLIHDSQHHQFIQGLIDRSNGIATDYECLLKLAQEYGNEVMSAHHITPALNVAWNNDIFGNAYDSFKFSATAQLRTVREWEKDIANK